MTAAISRANAPLAMICAHIFYSLLIDSVTEVCIQAAAAAEATERQVKEGNGNGGGVGGGGGAVVVSQKRRGSLLRGTNDLAFLTSSHHQQRVTSSNGNGAIIGSDSSSASTSTTTSLSFESSSLPPPTSSLSTSIPSIPSPRSLFKIRSGPLAVMQLDALVQKRLQRLNSFPCTDPLFGLPLRLVDAMTVFVDPLPLHWGDAVSTLTNVRVDEDPIKNVDSLVEALTLMDGAFKRYCSNRAAYLRSHPEARGVGEIGVLERSASDGPGGGLDEEEKVPLFLYCMAKSMVDRPVLVHVIARTAANHRGRLSEKAEKALELLQGAIEWAASLLRLD